MGGEEEWEEHGNFENENLFQVRQTQWGRKRKLDQNRWNTCHNEKICIGEFGLETPKRPGRLQISYNMRHCEQLIYSKTPMILYKFCHNRIKFDAQHKNLLKNW